MADAKNPCKFCGEHLVLSFSGRGWAFYHSTERTTPPTSIDDIRCLKSECLNAGGRVTQHEPVNA